MCVNRVPMLQMTLAMAIFGSIGFFTIKTGIPAVELVFVRCIFATIFLGFCWLITGQHKTEVMEKAGNYTNSCMWRLFGA